jgi:hypothetical protein
MHQPTNPAQRTTPKRWPLLLLLPQRQSSRTTQQLAQLAQAR